MIDRRRTNFDTSVLADMRVTLLRIALRAIIALEIVSIIAAGIFSVKQAMYFNTTQVILGILPILKLTMAGNVLFIYSKRHYKMILNTDRATRVDICRKVLTSYLFVLSLLIASTQQWIALILNISEKAIFTGSFVVLSVPFLILVEDCKLIRRTSFIEILLAFVDFCVYIIVQPVGTQFEILLTWISQILLCLIIIAATHMMKYFMLKIIRCYEVKLNSTESYRNVAETDALTSLSNRRALDLDTAIISQLGSKKICVAMFDIDKFKRFNDNYGHQVGDYVLSSVGKLARTIGDTDLCEAYRYGGEEILMIFLDRPTNEVIRQIQLFRSAVANIKIPSAEDTHITISAGLVSSELPDLTALKLPEEKLLDAGSAIILNLIHKADDNLYIAKNTGRNKLITGYATLTAGPRKAR